MICMNYIIHPIWFYLINIFEKISCIAGVIQIFSILMFIFGVIFYIAIMVDEPDIETNEEAFIGLITGLKKIAMVIMISTLLEIFIPNKDCLLEMLVDSQITTENIETTKEGAKEIIDYVVDKIENSENGQTKGE